MTSSDQRVRGPGSGPELLSPPTPRSFTSPSASPLTSPQVAGKGGPQQISPMPASEIKREQPDVLSPTGKLEPKDEAMDLLGQDQASLELKKLKRRQYQQKRRQSQGKEASTTPKKRPRKAEEDYDTFVENVMTQLRQLPPLSILEPTLARNHSACPVFGAGDATKMGPLTGELRGRYGSASLPNVSDHYNTRPFGPLPPLPPLPPPSTQRGFYDQEFASVRFDNDSDDKKDHRERDNDTPDTIISSSSPECVFRDLPLRFPGLQLIKDEDEDDSEEDSKAWAARRTSPVIPLVTPIPIRLRPPPHYAKDAADVDKENAGGPQLLVRQRFGPSPPAPLRDSGNVTVTLTLTAAAAEDIAGVLHRLAGILRVPAPAAFDVIERTSTPPSQKLGLYRTRGKDGKEGAPVDIQSILNGAAKFCRHCDVVILTNLIRKKVSEIPGLTAREELMADTGPDGDVYFCSAACYMQFALMHRSPALNQQEKAAAVVDHVSQEMKQEVKIKEEVVEPTRADSADGEAESDKLIIKIKEEVPDLDETSQTSTEPITPTCKAKEEPASAEPPAEEFQRPEKRSHRSTAGDEPARKVWKGVRYRYWSPGSIQPATKYKKSTEREITEMMFRMGITMTPPKMPEDTRKCLFCHQIGDGVADGPARLLNFDVDRWVHLNCALWSDDVYETVNGALMNLESALQQGMQATCALCTQAGATVRCFKLRCSSVYHLGCAVKDGCVFYKNKSMYCATHIPKNEKDNELTTLAVFRRVYVNRDENRQVAAVMHQSADQTNLLRVGGLIFLSVGQLLPHQLHAFHSPSCIYPIGYKIVRFYWSMRVPNKRCRYVCSIHDVAGRPEFRVLVQEPSQDDLELRDTSPRAVWARILEPLAALRRQQGGVQLFPKYLSGEDLFGLTEPAVVRVLESLPGVETLTDYRFKYGRNPLLELPLAVNPSGCARTEPRARGQLPWKRPHTQRTSTLNRNAPFIPALTYGGIQGEAACPYSKQFVHSKSSQYKKMKQEWRNNVYLARSKIQGLGLYAARDLERHTMVIEYIGEVIRTELSEVREKLYEAKNRGIYMFRLDEDRVVDATLSGGLARYINHSCNPNCVAETVEVERDLRIIIFAKRRISRGEELAYDYKFDIEDDQHKIPCNCGAPNCRKWMN